jgi:hypothetical protein
VSTEPSLLKIVANLYENSSDLPEPSRLVTALLEQEKASKKGKISYSFADLIGCWKLRFITGTKKTRKKAGIVLGSGRYIPRLIKIQIVYQGDRLNTGRVTNSVNTAGVSLSLTGPIKFTSGKNILAFDFTTIKITVFGISIYNGYLKNGREKEAEFEGQSLKNQAFFSYFFISDNAIAARGRGGGLALWTREK